MGRPIPVADAAVAEAALIAVLEQIDAGEFTADEISAHLIATASKVRFQPSTRQLVLTFDLAMGGDQGSSSGPVE